jgi:Uma2 family endonuclease
MSTTAVSRPVTPEDLESLPDAVAYELVDGNLVERRMGSESSEIAAIIISLLVAFVRPRRLGRVFGSDTSYQCFPEAPAKIRRADVGFVRSDRLPDGRAPKGNCPVAPDLAVEVICPNDTAEEVDDNIQEWLGAGVPLIWVVSPGTRSVRVHRPRAAPRGVVSLLAVDDVIDGEDVLPGFSFPVSELQRT